MINKIAFPVLLLSLLGTTAPAQAQESWSLDKCINYALKNNLTHRTYELDEQTAKIDATQSKLNLLPSVSASASAGTNYGRSVDLNSYNVINTDFFSNSNTLSSSVGLFHGFIQTNRIAYMKFRLKAAQWKKINYQDDLAFDVLSAYYDVIYYQGLVAISKEQLGLSEFNLKKTEAQIGAGIKAKTDLAEMQATYEKEKLNLIQAENKQEETRLKLVQQMNLPAGESVDVVNREAMPVVVPDLPSAADSLYASFVQLSPYVKMARAELDAASKNVAMARGQYFPSVYLDASVSTGYYETNKDANGKTISFPDQFDNNMNQYVGVSISIPVFSRNEVRSEFRKAKLAKEQARTQLDIYKQTVYYELMNNTRDLQALFREYVQTQKQVEANELAYKAAQRKYDEGLIDVIELLTVKSRLGESRSNLLSAELQWRIKDKILDFYEGVRFWEGKENGEGNPEAGEPKTLSGS